MVYLVHMLFNYDQVRYEKLADAMQILIDDRKDLGTMCSMRVEGPEGE